MYETLQVQKIQVKPWYKIAACNTLIIIRREKINES